MRFSIVVPLHRDGAAFRRCLGACLGLDHDDFEVLVVSDRPVSLPDDSRLVALTSGRDDDSSPAEKRDFAATRVTGDVIAYLDDDAYPSTEWLTVAEHAFANPAIRAIGGPGITPPDDAWRARAGGAVYESILGSGPLQYRFRPGRPRVVDDYPAYNLMVRTEAVRRAGGWATTFYGGEDTRFCEALAAIDVRVHYVPELLVYHHRRPIFRAHMRQVSNVGRHRGYFARSSGTSRRSIYFLPVLSASLVPLAAIGALRLGLVRAAVIGATAYAALAAAAPLPGTRVRLAFPAALAVHHASYGTAFLAGLATRNMDR